MYIILFVLISRALWFFRKTGGLKGLDSTEGLIEDKIISTGGAVAASVADKAAKKMDEHDQQQKAIDVEQDA